MSFFQGVRANPDGDLEWLGSAGPGASIELVAELPLIVLVANVPHPLDPREDYIVGPLQITAWASQPTGEGDAVFSLTPERERAYRNSITYAALAGL